MDIKIYPNLSKFKDSNISAPPSKSYTHRAITVAALSKNSSKILNPLISEDTNATISACRQFGADLKINKRDLEIYGFDGSKRIKSPVLIDVKNSGTTLRFFTAISALCEGCVRLTGDDSLLNRPNTPLLNALEDLGAKIFSNDGKAPIDVCGRLKGGKTVINGSMSSQFISALLLSTPFAKEDTTLCLKEVKSRPYIDMTLEVIREAGGRIIRNEYGYFIPSNQVFNLKSFSIPGDFSSASYFLVASSLIGLNLVMTGLKDSAQGDKIILDILKNIGAQIEWNKNEGRIRVSSTDKKFARLKSFKMDIGDTPDLFPTLAVLATRCDGVSELFNAQHLRYKESDRISKISKELRKMGAKIIEKRDGAIIGQSNLKGAVLESYGDHRLAMALSIAALLADRPSIIKNVECVDVSYPHFFDDLKKIGTRMEVVT
ncbi:MAG: 3-phosphoshikimate 1-carboxyvinyltransferase [Candidatus Methanoliparum thermophilum]|uniref:3-phosphoshikimate 1-carboxyvinyltransferase n=1 Tax=Methanoliparum thermophilum TaxID=2491083 RepID=A0A520KTH4_METT2|nr:3-phosphoshikimate 1-carboxyvinyltransferase [Candidatus Methanoliparum sp. LAM-1]RZN65382.1 MAG: 3-phosphoshikimate 1-carboxyvinyltransferase [Candidatus Methanoliparum thermophilum]BDC35532.1 3-phosphoshikimate 1-carboxyvinyltransferase [Candidatus Methanoliparum sp. LAM-1]